MDPLEAVGELLKPLILEGDISKRWHGGPVVSTAASPQALVSEYFTLCG